MESCRDLGFFSTRLWRTPISSFLNKRGGMSSSTTSVPVPEAAATPAAVPVSAPAPAPAAPAPVAVPNPVPAAAPVTGGLQPASVLPVVVAVPVAVQATPSLAAAAAAALSAASASSMSAPNPAAKKCSHAGCERVEDDSSSFYRVPEKTSAGGQDWSSLIGRVLCSSCYQR